MYKHVEFRNILFYRKKYLAYKARVMPQNKKMRFFLSCKKYTKIKEQQQQIGFFLIRQHQLQIILLTLT